MKNIRFCAFSLPNQDFQLFIELPNSTSNTPVYFEFAPFNSSSNEVIRLSADLVIAEYDSAELQNEIWQQVLTLPTLPRFPDSTEAYNEHKENYISNLSKAIDKMPVVGIDKFIYSRIERHSRTNFEVWKTLKELNATYPSTLTYYFHHEKTGRWMGATPETLGTWQGHKFETMALAATMQKQVPVEKWGIKELEEHKYVTSYIQHIFERNHIECLYQPTEVIKAGPVFHLQTKLSSKNTLNFKQAKLLITQLHPTPAICGVPLDKAQKFITQTELHKRAYYTGYLGIIEHNKRIELFVNLRCMQIFSNYVDLYLGGGITQKSNVIDEWNETNHKAKTLLNVLKALE